jgi:REP element-mobilizing transposase RayT
MARKPRIHYPGALYHVMLWGNGGEEIFFEDDDRRRFLELVEGGVARFGHRIHAFCLMPNHVHFAIQVGELPLSKVMQNLSFRYTGWINRGRGRRGHLFHGRYKAILVDHDLYLFELTRYIHLNPVRAGLVRDPVAYPWSGHRYYLGKGKAPWLTTDWVLSQFSKQVGAARARYAQFVADGLGAGRREEFHRGTQEGRLLGDDQFVSRVLAQAEARVGRPPTLRAIVTAVCWEGGFSEAAMCAPGRRSQAAQGRWLVGLLATDLNSVSLTEVARYFGRDVATLSNGVRQLRERSNDDKQFRQRVARLAKRLGENKTSKA